jgi:DNA-binding transcriptional LysR family regulator
MRPDLSSLALFICIAETRSITKAAEKCHIALAAASRRIAQLEHQLGVQLLFRTSRGVEVTPAGNAMLFHARRMLEQVDEMRAELSDYSKGAKGLVRVQANTSVLAQWLPEDLATFSALYPAIKVSLEEERSSMIVEAIHAGTTDIGIVMEGPDTGALQCFDYRTDILVAVVAKKHPLRGKQVAFEKLLDYDIAGLESNTVISGLLAERAAAAGKPLRLRVQVKGFDVVARMAQAGLGIGILPETAALAFAAPLGLRLVRLTDEWAVRKSRVCVRQYASLPASARQLVDHLVPPQNRGPPE